MDMKTDNQVKVLVIEGNSEVRSYIRTIFVACGDFDVSFASADPESMRHVEEFAPDVVYLDYSLSAGSARNVLRALPIIPEMEDVPVVFASNCHQQSEVDDLYERGSATVVARPIAPFAMPGQIIKVLEQAHA